MEKNKVWKIVCLVIWILQLAAEAAVGGYVFLLDMLPGRYFAIVIAALVVVWLLIGAMMFFYRKHGRYETGEEGPGKARRVVAIVLAILVIVGCIALCFILHDVYSTVAGISGDDSAEADGVTMAAYVLTDDAAQSLQDAAYYSFGVVTGYEEARTNVFLDSIESAIGREIIPASFASVSEMIDAFYAGDVRIIILNSAYVQLMEDNDMYSDFSDMTRILYSEVINIEENTGLSGEHVQDDPLNTGENVAEEQDRTVANHPFIVYVSGSDTRNTYLTTSRSDVNILMIVNPVSKQVLLVNTPRDYYIPNPSGGGALDKLTHCGIYGISCSMEALGDLYGVEVDYYAQINFTGFETLIDAIGGIEVYSDTSFRASSANYSFSKGYNYLNGAQALAFARERYNLSSGDNGRGQNQMKVITAVIKKATSGTTIISNYSSILNSISGMFKTDLSTEEISSLVKMQLDDMATWDVFSYAVTGYGDSEITYSMPGLYAYVMRPDQDTVDHASSLISRIMEGETLTADDIELQ